MAGTLRPQIDPDGMALREPCLKVWWRLVGACGAAELEPLLLVRVGREIGGTPAFEDAGFALADLGLDRAVSGGEAFALDDFGKVHLCRAYVNGVARAFGGWTVYDVDEAQDWKLIGRFAAAGKKETRLRG